MITVMFSIVFIMFLLFSKFLLAERKKMKELEERSALLEQALEQVKKTHPVLVNADLVFAEQLREINTQLVSMDNQLQELENKHSNDGGCQHVLRIL